MHVSHRVYVIPLVAVLLLGFGISWFSSTVKASPKFLNVTVSPQVTKLFPKQAQVFVASCNGELPAYSWFAFASGDLTANINGVSVSLGREFRKVATGESLTFEFPEATNCLVRLKVEASTANGGSGQGEVAFYDPYTSSGVYMDALPSTANYICEGDGTGWFRAISKLGQQDASGTSDDDDIQYAINQTTVSGGMVFVRAGVYSASVTVKDNVCFVLDYGITSVGVAYSIDSGADCTIIDYTGKLRRDYVAGNLVYQFNYATGNELISSANITTIYAGTIDQIDGSGVKVLKLVIQNGTSFPSGAIDKQFFYRSDSGYLYLYNSTASSWVQLGTTAYGNLSGTPDLTVYLNKAGTVALTGNWNVGGSYGIYGATWLNSTYVNANQYFLAGTNVTNVLIRSDLSGIVYANHYSNLQAAINAVPSGGTVIIPAGTYHQPSTNTPVANLTTKTVTLQGVSPQATILEQTDGGAPVIQIGGTGWSYHQNVQDLTVSYAYGVEASYSNIEVNPNGGSGDVAAYGEIRNVRMDNIAAAHYGLYLC
ncbi:hypothetical protein MUP38_05920, partial [Candidatus Bathyarchaeota archaeon]|nr:hypothetical protein [Candidatus Bathyarchaeota archaeon]